jgi:hypothetical protein
MCYLLAPRAPAGGARLTGAALVGAALLAGCAGDHADPVAPLGASAALAAAAAPGDAGGSRLALAAAVDDALTRVVPALEG